MNKVNLIEAGLEVGDTVWFLDGTTKVVKETNSNNCDYPIGLDSNHRYTKYGELMMRGSSGVNIFLAPVTLEIPTKKPETDWSKVFTLDKPFMVRYNGSCWCFGYAVVYLQTASSPFFVVDEGKTTHGGEGIEGFEQARKLTKQELEERNLPSDIYEN